MNNIVLKHREMGSLKQVAESLWREMKSDIQKNGHSDHTLTLEGAYYSIRDILEINNIEEVREICDNNNGDVG